LLLERSKKTFDSITKISWRETMMSRMNAMLLISTVPCFKARIRTSMSSLRDSSKPTSKSEPPSIEETE